MACKNLYHNLEKIGKTYDKLKKDKKKLGPLKKR